MTLMRDISLVLSPFSTFFSSKMMRWQLLLRSMLRKPVVSKLLVVSVICIAGSVTVWQVTHSASTDEISISDQTNDRLPHSGKLQQELKSMEILNIGTKRLVHLDLKGAPPKISYYEELFPVLRQWGATGLLVEWEDTFPYWGAELSIIGSSGPDSPGVYSRQQAEELLGLAAQFGLEVIPLVQTFGHFEFVLKHDAFRSLREVESFPSSLCPSHSDALPLVQAMVSQIIDLHPGLQTLHIGADEVWHLGLCNACQHRMSQMPGGVGAASRDRLFLEHVSAVLRWLRSAHPNLQLIMWDDMLRHMDPLLLQEYELGKLVEPTVWHYRPTKTFHLPHDLWSKYSSVFGGVWVATAFKGASGSNALLPAVTQHLDCQERWLRELQEQHEKGVLPNVRGVAITGWSRYDHYAVICELLPASLPSLALCLAQWQAGTFSPEVHSNVSRVLGYPDGELVSLNPQPQPQQHQPHLTYPGWKVRVGVEWLVNLQGKVSLVTESEQSQTWLNSFLVRQRFSNPVRILSLRRKFKRLLDEMASLERFLRPVMETVLPPLTVEEWFGTTLEPGRDRLRQLLHEAERQVALGGRVRGYLALA